MNKILLVMLVFASAANAQSLPDAPKPHHIVERVESIALAGAAAYDWKTTSDLQARGGYERNAAWAIGHYPSNLKITVFGAAWTTGELIGFHYTERSHHRWIKWAGRLYVAWAVEEHVRWGLHNSRINGIPPYNDTCGYYLKCLTVH